MSEDPQHPRELCGCELDREEVLFAALQRTIAEVCEHKTRERAERRAPAPRARAIR